MSVCTGQADFPERPTLQPLSDEKRPLYLDHQLQVTHGYTVNGLDQYGQIMGDAQEWDTRGNLFAYRGVSYGYDGENPLAGRRNGIEHGDHYV